VIDSGSEAVEAPASESVTVAVKVKVPAVVHVPVIAPVEALRLSAGGSEPLLIDHVSGGTPPVAVSVALYELPTVQLGSVVVVIVRTGGG
jgi:hypothetical protein